MEAAVRELFEETGLKAVDARELVHAGVHGGVHRYFAIRCDDLTIGAVTGPELDYAKDAGFKAEWVPIASLPSIPVWPRCVAEHLASVGIDGEDHVQLAMPAGGEAQAIAFYEGVLGIRHVQKPPHLATRGGCWFEDGDLKVHLGVDAAFSAATKAHPAFIVADVRGLADRITAVGHRVVDDEPLEGSDRVYAYDPFGNRIELMQPLT